MKASTFRAITIGDCIISIASFGMWSSLAYSALAPKAWPPILVFIVALPATVLGAYFLASMRRKREQALAEATEALRRSVFPPEGVITLERLERARQQFAESKPRRFEDLPPVLLTPRELDDPEVRKRYQAYVAACEKERAKGE